MLLLNGKSEEVMNLIVNKKYLSNQVCEMDIKAHDFIINNICEYPNRTIDLRLYDCEYVSGEFKLHDHFEYAWVELTSLLDYDLAPADIPLATFLINNK